EQHQSFGQGPEACDDLLTLGYIQLQHRGDYAEGRRLVEAALPFATDYPDGQANIQYFLGVAAGLSGDSRSALGLLRNADAQSRRLGNDDLTRATALRVAEVYQQLGKWSEVFDSLAAAGAGEDAPGGCLRADWLTSRAWALLMARESNDPHARLE